MNLTFSIYPDKKPYNSQVVIIAYDGEYVMPAQYVEESGNGGFKPYYTEGIVIQGQIYWTSMPSYPTEKDIL